MNQPYQMMGMQGHHCSCPCHDQLRDHGPDPFVTNIHEDTCENNAFRRTLWTGDYLQVTLMSLMPGECGGIEMHPHVDQFLRIEQGQGFVQIGAAKDSLSYMCHVFDDCAIVIPAGTWHNLTNTGCVPLKLYSIYAPPNHPFGTVQQTNADVMAAGEYGHHD